MEYLRKIDWLKNRLQEKLPGVLAHELMMARVRAMPTDIPVDARESAVLILLFPHEEELHLLLIKRAEDGHAHSGQISFPGGRKDSTDESLQATALREANEEVGINESKLKILGQLSPLYIPVSNFHVFPFVAYAEERLEYYKNQQEVAAIIEIPIEEIFSDKIKTIAKVTSPADKTFVRNVNAYQLEDGTIIWGATAMILSELEVVLKEYIS